MRPLVVDNENQAVRCFLMFYGSNPVLTIAQMANNLKMSGYTHYPDWIEEAKNDTMTKAAAQDWLRYLFSLETKACPKNI